MKIYCSRDYSQDYIVYHLDRFVGKDIWIAANVGPSKHGSLDSVYDCTIKIISQTDSSYKFYKVYRVYLAGRVVPLLNESLERVYTARKTMIHVRDPLTVYTTEEVFNDFAEYGSHDDDYDDVE